MDSRCLLGGIYRRPVEQITQTARQNLGGGAGPLGLVCCFRRDRKTGVANVL